VQKIAKEDFALLLEKVRTLPDTDSLVLKGLLDRETTSDAELAADLSLLPKSVMSSIQNLDALNLVDVERTGKRGSAKVRLNRYGIEAASFLRSLEKLERSEAAS
jgi:predicted transcriptional regulator